MLEVEKQFHVFQLVSQRETTSFILDCFPGQSSSSKVMFASNMKEFAPS